MWNSQCRAGSTCPGQHLGPEFRAQPGGLYSTFSSHVSNNQGLGLTLHPPNPTPPKEHSWEGCCELCQDPGDESWEQSLKPVLEAVCSGSTWPPLGPWLEGEVHLGSPRLLTPILHLPQVHHIPMVTKAEHLLCFPCFPRGHKSRADGPITPAHSCPPRRLDCRRLKRPPKVCVPVQGLRHRDLCRRCFEDPDHNGTSRLDYPRQET